VIVLEFGKDLLDDDLAEEGGFRTDLEAGHVGIDGCKLTVVEVEHLTVLANERRFLLLEIFRVDYRSFLDLFPCHVSKYSKKRTKLVELGSIFIIKFILQDCEVSDFLNLEGAFVLLFPTRIDRAEQSPLEV